MSGYVARQARNLDRVTSHWIPDLQDLGLDVGVACGPGGTGRMSDGPLPTHEWFAVKKVYRRHCTLDPPRHVPHSKPQ